MHCDYETFQEEKYLPENCAPVPKHTVNKTVTRYSLISMCITATRSNTRQSVQHK